MCRNSFSYIQLAKDFLADAREPILPSDMLRIAIDMGAPHQGEALRRELRVACESIAISKGYKRTRVKGVTGYHYQKA